ncbi:MAG: hypothetical protein ACT4QG_17945 [Sporichthyaceae bacterium]
MYPPAWQHQWGRWDWYPRHKRGGIQTATAMGRADMTVTRVGETGPAGSRHTRRIAVALGASALASCLTATVASAAPTPDATPPTLGSADCTPSQTLCRVPELQGRTHRFEVGATGGVRAATLAAEVNTRNGPVCPGFGPVDTDWVRVGFRDLVAGSSWNKVVAITARTGLASTAAAEAVRSAKVCFEAPYRFFVRPGFRMDKGPVGRGPFRGVLASCSTVDSTFPIEARGRVQPLPCVQQTRATAVGGTVVIQHVVRIPRDAAVTSLRPNL